jgi:pimeloyl-ACP methyl ester carboxylesterase
MTTTREGWLAGGSRVQVSGSPHTLFVRQDGPADGKPVTLLHGFPTSSHDWADVLPFLTEAGYRVTTLDFLGYGVSVAQELLARDPKRITSMAWLNGGLFPDLHRPTRGQKLLRSRLGPVVAPLIAGFVS